MAANLAGGGTQRAGRQEAGQANDRPTARHEGKAADGVTISKRLPLLLVNV